jgi:Cdc6-like AAA superfamily ATPase
MKQFEPGSIKVNNFIAIYGEKHTGKTNLIQHILAEQNHPRHIVTSEKAYQYQDAVSTNVAFDNAYVQLFIIKQKRAHAKEPCIVLIDDAIFSKTAYDTRSFRELAVNGICMKMGLVLIQQCVIALPPNLRTQVAHVFVFKTLSQILQRIYDMFVEPTGISYSQFHALYTIATNEPYTCLVISCKSRSNEIDEVFSYYKAPNMVIKSTQMNEHLSS